MFETEIDEGGSFLSFALQQVGVCIASLFSALVTAEVPRGLSSSSGGSLAEALCIITLGFVPALLCGVLVQGNIPRVAASGRWGWLLPSFLVLALLFSSFPGGRFMHEIEGLLYPEKNGEAWWGVMLLTYPWLGCLGYSLGIIFGARFEQKQSKRKTEEGA